MSESKIANMVNRIAEPLAENLGLKIWDIKLVKEGPNQYLRVFIDKDEGITLDDCENMSRALDEPLDILDPIPDSYSLEVSSPGIERELTKDWHLKKFLNSNIKIRLIRPHENKSKELIGELISFDKEHIIIDHQEYSKISIERKNISHINLIYEEEIKE